MPMARCPHCRVTLTADEAERRNCPECGKSLGAMASSEESGSFREPLPGGLDDDMDWDRPRHEPVASSRADLLGWGGVLTGLLMTPIAVLVVVFGLWVFVLLMLLQWSDDLRSMERVYLRDLMGLVVVIGQVAGFVTQMTVAFAPGRSKAKAMGVLYVIGLIAAFMLFVFFLDMRVMIGGIAAGLVALGAYVCYVLALYRIANYFRNRGLAIHIFAYLFISIAVAVLTVAALMLLSSDGAVRRERWQPVLAASVATGLTLWYAVIHFLVRATVIRGSFKGE